MMEWVFQRVYSNRLVTPPSMKWKTLSLREYANVYTSSIRDPVSFWERQALNLKWGRMWDVTFSGTPPRARWFVNGVINAYYNVIGRHRGSWVWSKPALIWEGEDGDVRVVSYEDLHEIVVRISSALRELGVKPGDWITFYTPPMIESTALMLASVRLGAPFEPVFTGFGYGELAKRIKARKPKIIVSVDGFLRRGRVINSYAMLQKALELAKHKAVIVVIERIGLTKGVELTFSDLLHYSGGLVEDYEAPSDHPLFGLHSAYLDDFKPITHAIGGYLVQVYATSRWMGLRPHDTYFCTVWPGWITGVSYVVFGPLMVGSTVVLYEGGPDWPSWDRWWDVIERYAVTLLLTTGGALRILSRQGDDLVRKHNMDTLRAILVTAEPLEVNVWEWAYKVVGTGYTPVVDSNPEELTGRIPVVNMYIQSEIGTFITGNLVNYTFPPIIPGSCGPPIPGFHLDVIDDSGQQVKGSLGELVLKAPWPALPLEAPEDFYSKWSNGVYRTGDYAVMTQDNYVFVLGRRDNVMKASGYRLSPGALKKTIMDVRGVEEAIVLVCPDDIRLQAPVVVIKGYVDVDSIKRFVREYLGPIAEPREIVVVNAITDVLLDDMKKNYCNPT